MSLLTREFLDTVTGIPNSRTEIVMLEPPDGAPRPGAGGRYRLASAAHRLMRRRSDVVPDWDAAVAMPDRRRLVEGR